MTDPPRTSLVRRYDTHRLIPSRYSKPDAGVLARIADDDRHLADILDLDNGTDDRLLAENELLPGIGVGELVFGVPYYRIVNAAFTHAHPLGSRFNGPDRGAWYAAFEIETAQTEIAFHKTLQLAEIGRFEDDVTVDDYLADFSGEFHDLRDGDFAKILDPESYVQSQALAERLVEAGALGVVYPSVRRDGGTCLACFRPALVMNVRKGATYRLRWGGGLAGPALRDVATGHPVEIDPKSTSRALPPNIGDALDRLDLIANQRGSSSSYAGMGYGIATGNDGCLSQASQD